MSDSLQLAPGSLFAGEYKIVRRLGGGGMGAVYVAEQQSTGTERALKLMHPELIRDPKLRVRFEQEARVGARIQSDHVVQVIGAGVDAPTGTPWLAMELLEGEDLSVTVERQGPPPPGDTLEIFRQLCHALGAAHAVGVVHRDLKPENIFLAVARRAGERFTVKVLDFGIAKVIAEAKATETDAIGTPLWMAPEQTEPSARIAPAADVWALGLIAYWLLTGCHYWKSAVAPNASVPTILREVLFEPIVAASERARELGHAEKIPAGFNRWFESCVTREVGSRYPDATAAFEILERVLTGSESASSAAGVVGPTGTTKDPPPAHPASAPDAPSAPTPGTHLPTHLKPEPASAPDRPAPTVNDHAPIRPGSHPDATPMQPAPATPWGSPPTDGRASPAVPYYPVGGATPAGHYYTGAVAQPAKRRGAGWLVWAFLFLVALGAGAVGIAVFVPEVREQLPEEVAALIEETTGEKPEPPTPPPATPPPEPKPAPAPAAEELPADPFEDDPEDEKEKKKDKRQVAQPAPTGTSSRGGTPPRPTATSVPPGGSPTTKNFDQRAASAALSRAKGRARPCAVGQGKMFVRVSVTWGLSGRPSKTTVSGPKRGSVSSCIARAYQRERIPAYSGRVVTTSHSYKLDVPFPTPPGAKKSK